MALAASTLVQRAVDISQDVAAIRWTTDEWVRWLNDGQREIAIYRPDVFAIAESMNLVAGARQQLPTTAIKLIDIPNNTSGTKSAIRQIDRAELDANDPSWRNATAATVIKHFVHDPRAPLLFDVYPPAAGTGAAVDIVYAKYPAVIAQPGVGKTYTDVVGNIGVPDLYANVLLDYMLYRGYMKDADVAANASRAASHYSQFASALGIEVQSSLTVAPKPKSADGAGG